MKDHNARLAQTDSATRPESFEEIARDMQRILRESNAALRENSRKLRRPHEASGCPLREAADRITTEDRGLAAAAFDDRDFFGREVVELVDEVVDFAVCALDLKLNYSSEVSSCLACNCPCNSSILSTSSTILSRMVIIVEGCPKFS